MIGFDLQIVIVGISIAGIILFAEMFYRDDR